MTAYQTNKTPFLKDLICFFNGRRHKYEVIEEGLFLFDLSITGQPLNPRPLRPLMVITKRNAVMRGATRTRMTAPLRLGWIQIHETDRLTHQSTSRFCMRPWRRLLDKASRTFMWGIRSLWATQRESPTNYWRPFLLHNNHHQEMD